MGACGHVRRRPGRVGSRAVLRRALVHAADRRARGSVPHSVRPAQHRARADAVLRRHAQLRRDVDHSDDVARRRPGRHRRHRLRPDLGCRHHDRLQPRQVGSDERRGQGQPLGSIHQELQFAKAANLSAYGALNWRGYPGLLLGGSVFSGKAGPGPAGLSVAERGRDAGGGACAMDAGSVRPLRAVRARPHQRHGALQPDGRRQPDADPAGVLRLVRAGGVVRMAARRLPVRAIRVATSASTPAGNMRPSRRVSRPDALPTAGRDHARRKFLRHAQHRVQGRLPVVQPDRDPTASSWVSASTSDRC